MKFIPGQLFGKHNRNMLFAVVYETGPRCRKSREKMSIYNVKFREIP